MAPDYPLQKKRHSFEFLRTIAHLRPRTNTIGAVLRVRNVAARAIHDFFQSRGFVWLHAPILTPPTPRAPARCSRSAGSEGVLRPHRRGSPCRGSSRPRSARSRSGNVYTFGPTFRAENSNTSRHLAEFWMVEPEMAFCDLDGDVALAEAFLSDVLARVLEDAADDMAFFDERIEKGAVATLEHVVASPFERLSYTEAIAILEKSGECLRVPGALGRRSPERARALPHRGAREAVRSS